MGMYEPIKGDDEEEVKKKKRDDDKVGDVDDDDEDIDIDVEMAVHSRSRASVPNKLEEEKHHRRHQQPPPQSQSQRVVSLDVFRGLTVALMIFVDDAGGVLPAINHSPWDGLNLADFVMPFFLFIVGVSLALTYKKLSCRAVATRKAILRALKLLILGLFLQGGFLHGLNDLTYGVDVEHMRWMGILQRIAIAYLLAALCEIWLKGVDNVNSGSSLLRNYRFQWVFASMLTTLYLSFLYGLYVPDWEYQIPIGISSSLPKLFSVKCGVRGDTGPACNAIGMIDRKILGIGHLYKRAAYARTQQCSINSPSNGPLPPGAPSWCQAPFDPEGLLSSVMAIVTCLVGLHYGHIIVHFKDHKDRIFHWMITTSCLILLGLGLDFCGMHLNKVLYTFSYMCFTAGVAGILFAAIYLMVDVCGYRRLTLVMEWMGVHALMIYILAACNVLPFLLQGFYWGKPQNNILRLIGIGS
ncbi:heparan-alpha-glucosaminide N-acetyltransferase [Fagus crenata]